MEEELDLGLHRSPLDDLELLRGWDLVVELLRGWDLVVELLRGWDLVVLQEQYTQVCDLLESLELWWLLLAFSFSLVFSSQVRVSSLLNWG